MAKQAQAQMQVSLRPDGKWERHERQLEETKETREERVGEQRLSAS